MAASSSTIGRFHIVAELGRGGMGIVYKVKDPRNGQLMALKMIPPEALARADSELRFKREFRAMQRVEHPNVIRVFDAGTHEGCPYFTMELIEGRDVRRWLDGDEPVVPSGKDPPPAGLLTEEQRRRLNDPVRTKKLADAIVQVAYALAEIHRHRIVHRDLKPDNILVSKAGVVKLMDFGIAKQLSGASEHSSGGMVVGTFKYLSPEQALGAEVDGRADLYCLGIILYELLAGRHPFYSENSVGYAYHHARKPPPDIVKFNPEVHKGLKAVCERLIKKDARERFPTAEDVVAAIREAMTGFAEEMSTKYRAAPKASKDLPFELAKDQLFAPSLVGRASAQRQLLTSVEQLLAGRGAIVALTGPRGIGKTRLVREVSGLAKARNIDFLWGTCGGGGLPYQPYLDILDQLVQRAADTLPADELRRLLGDEARVLARHVGALERLEPEVRPRPAPQLDPQGERVRFLSAVTAFLGRSAAAQPRVVVIDEIHAADEMSLQLTRHLADTLARADPPGDGPAQRFSPLALVFALDPAETGADEARALLSRLSQERGFLSLALSALDPGEVQEMLASMIGGGEVAQALADYLHRETEGIPGAVEERVRAWAESGELRRKGRQWVLQRARTKAKVSAADAGIAVAPPPARANDEPVADSGVDDVVAVKNATRADIPLPDQSAQPSARRIGRLSQVARDVAERMAIVGERVPSALLLRIALRSEDELLDALDELLKREIVIEDKLQSFFRFKEAADVAALRSGLTVDKRQHLHLLVARSLEEDAKRNRRPVDPEEQARHFQQGGDLVKAIEQLMQAARMSLAASATQSAAQRVGEAQELLQAQMKAQPSDVRLQRCDVELVLLRLDVLAAVNVHTECVDLARRRLPRMRTLVDARLVSETLLRLASSERVLGDLDEALTHVGEVLAMTERGGNHALRCRAKSLCGSIYEQRGQFELAARYYSDALELARSIGDELEEERARFAIAQRRLTSGDLVHAKEDFERLLKSAEGRGEKLRIISYVNSLGIIAHEEGRYEDAELSYRRMFELAKPTGDRRSLAIAHGNIGVVRRDQGRFADALGQCERAAKILKELNQLDVLAYVRIVESQTLLDRALLQGSDGDNAAAREKADEAFDLAEKASAALRLAEASICRGQALVRLGNVDEGRADIERGLDAARSLGANRVLLFGLGAHAEARALTGDLEGARADWRDAFDRAKGTGFLRFVKRLADLKEKRHL
ncbi:MAG: protein kinase [Deltaproteobacteria bacterium]|nr:protein kinase [Deltaproteobacteria bacterium]